MIVGIDNFCQIHNDSDWQTDKNNTTYFLWSIYYYRHHAWLARQWWQWLTDGLKQCYILFVEHLCLPPEKMRNIIIMDIMNDYKDNDDSDWLTDGQKQCYIQFVEQLRLQPEKMRKMRNDLAPPKSKDKLSLYEYWNSWPDIRGCPRSRWDHYDGLGGTRGSGPRRNISSHQNPRVNQYCINSEYTRKYWTRHLGHIVWLLNHGTVRAPTTR